MARSKKPEKLIEKSEDGQENYRIIFELSPDAIAVHDGKTLKLINPAGVKMLGAQSAEELVGRPIISFVHPKDHEAVRARFDQERQGRHVPTAIQKLIRVDGTFLDVEVSETPYTYQGEPATLVFLRDITERRQAEEALRESEARMRQAQHFARMGSWTWNIKSNTLDWSDEMYVVFGLDKETFSGSLADVLTQAIHPDDRDKVEMSNAMLARGEKPDPLECRIVWKDGSVHMIYAEAGETVYDETGQPAYIRGIAQEITERKQAELLLRKSESRLHQATHIAGLGIWDWDPITDHVEWSGEMFRIYGITREEFTGKGSDYFEFTRADYREIQEQNVAEAFKHGVTEADLMQGKGIKFNPKELCIVRPDGTECYTAGDAICIIDENGKPLRMLGVTQDITERKEAENKLRESEERYRSLSSAAFEGIAIHDQGIIKDANQAFAEFFGYETPDDLIGKNGFEILPFTAESIERMKLNMTSWGSDPLEVTVIRPDGSYIQGETQGRAFNVKGRTMRVVAMRDITKRKQAESTHARLTAILEATPDFVAIADTGRSITYLNQAGRKMVGIGLDEDISDLQIGDLTPDWAKDVILNEALPTAIESGVWSGESSRLHRDGREIPVMQVILAHYEPDGSLGYLSTICRDITDRKRAEEKIRRQLDHLTALSEIDRAITSSLDLGQSLKTLLNQVVQQLGVDAADAMLFEEDAHTLKYIAGLGFRSKGLEDFSMSDNKGYAGKVIAERRMVKITNLLEKPEDYARRYLLADDAFVSYFGIPLIAKDHIKGVLEVFHRAPLEPDEEWLDFFDALAEQAAIAIDNALLFNDLHSSKVKLEQAYDTTLDGWSKALDLRDRETEGHTRRVTDLTLQVARRMGFSEEELTQIKRGGLLHDIGKMGIPDAILLKPGTLTDEEWVVMRKHTTYAYEMLSPIEYLQPALDIPYCHHEHWDGSGYPRGLKGHEIPLVARIFSVVDVWDALRSDRPYRKAWDKEKVLQYIASLTGKQFDPEVVRVFMQMTGNS